MKLGQDKIAKSTEKNSRQVFVTCRLLSLLKMLCHRLLKTGIGRIVIASAKGIALVSEFCCSEGTGL